MRKRDIICLLAVVCANILLWSCSKQEHDKPSVGASPTSVTLNGTESATFNITSNTSWTIVSSDSWVNCSPASGTGGQSITVHAISENPGTSARTATLTISDRTGNASTTVRVTQNAPNPDPQPDPQPDPDQLSVSPTSLSIGYAGGDETFTVTTNVTSWQTTSNSSWCTVTTSGNTAKVHAEENTSNTSRTATVTVRAGNATPCTVTVTQDAKPEQSYYLTVDKSELQYTIEGGDVSFAISSNDDWTISTSHSWVTCSPGSGSGDRTVTVTVLPNSTESNRTATITVKGSKSGAERTVSVLQSSNSQFDRNDFPSGDDQLPDYTLSVNVTSLSFGSGASQKNITVTGGDRWTVSSSTSWCTVSPASGSGNGTVRVNVTKNEATTNRSAYLTFTGTNSGKVLTVYVSQDADTPAPTPVTFDATPTYLEFDAKPGGTKSITVTGNDNWTATSDKSWCQLSTNGGTGAGTVVVTVSEHTGQENRSAQVTLVGASSGKTISVTVMQKGTSSIDLNGFGNDSPLPNN